MSIIAVDQLTIRNGRAICDVSIAREKDRFTTPALAQRVIKTYPNLPDHTCINKQNETFGAVIDNTSVPHLLEHLVIDMQTILHQQDPLPQYPTFTGTTEWTDQGRGKARIEVSFTDDLVVLRAFREALHFLEHTMVE